MIVEYIRYKLPNDQSVLNFLQGYRAAEKPLQASPHCLGYELTACADEPLSLILRIEWDSVEGHMQRFRKSPEFQEFFAAVKPFVGMIEEMRHYEHTGIAFRR